MDPLVNMAAGNWFFMGSCISHGRAGSNPFISLSVRRILLLSHQVKFGCGSRVHQLLGRAHFGPEGALGAAAS